MFVAVAGAGVAEAGPGVAEVGTDVAVDEVVPFEAISFHPIAE